MDFYNFRCQSDLPFIECQKNDSPFIKLMYNSDYIEDFMNENKCIKNDNSYSFKLSNVAKLDIDEIGRDLSRKNPVAVVDFKVSNKKERLIMESYDLHCAYILIHKSLIVKSYICEMVLPKILKEYFSEYIYNEFNNEFKKYRNFVSIFIEVKKELREIMKFLRKVREAKWPDGNFKSLEVNVKFPEL